MNELTLSRPSNSFGTLPNFLFLIPVFYSCIAGLIHTIHIINTCTILSRVVFMYIIFSSSTWSMASSGPLGLNLAAINFVVD